jgi:hypothetical protein
MAYLRDDKTDDGYDCSVFTCDTCGQEYSICPVPENKDDWQNCMEKSCDSYDSDRDLDHWFDDGNVLSFSARHNPAGLEKVLKG